jgi:DNA polymerase elongation subunit (family B)
MLGEASQRPICGVWIDEQGRAHVSLAAEGGGRSEAMAEFRPFAWLRERPDELPPHAEVEKLSGEGLYTVLVHTHAVPAHEALLKQVGAAGYDVLRPLECQFLLQKRRRLYDGLRFQQLRRCQLDIETAAAGEDHFSDPTNAGDRVLAIGLRFGERTELIELAADTDDAERDLLQRFNAVLATENPDTIEGHNLFKFDLVYLRERGKRLKVPCARGRFRAASIFRNTRFKLRRRCSIFLAATCPAAR